MRDLEGNLNSSTPVIMLTANAIMGAKEEYISQGFDDYLSKPIEGIQLEEMLIKYLPEDKVESVLDDKKSDDDKASDILEDKEAADDRASDILEDKDAVDDSGDDSPEAVFKRLEKIPEIDVSTGIHYCGDFPDIYLDALNEYIKSGLGDELRKDYNIKDWKNYRIHAHALKGVSLNIGAKELFEEAKELEMLAKEENEEALLSKTEGVLDKNEELLKKLKKCLNV